MADTPLPVASAAPGATPQQPPQAMAADAAGAAASTPAPNDGFHTSAAGEEDPGAGAEILAGAAAAANNTQPAGAQPPYEVHPVAPTLQPGDEAPAGSPGTAEGISRTDGSTVTVGVGGG